jgi:hypothetical protein
MSGRRGYHDKIWLTYQRWLSDHGRAERPDLREPRRDRHRVGADAELGGSRAGHSQRL